ncbi:MAG: flagellar biosynthetic protein FliO [Candidatus Neomarinimicrobiota bacterium]
MNNFRLPGAGPKRGSLAGMVIFAIIMIWGFYLVYSGEPRQFTPPPINPEAGTVIAPVATEPGLGGQIIRTVVVTAAIIVLILMVARWYRRALPGGGSLAGLQVAVQGRHYLSARQSLLLVEIEGRRLLLGVTDNGINLVTEFEPGEPAETIAGTPIAPAGPALPDSFAGLLNRFRKS